MTGWTVDDNGDLVHDTGGSVSFLNKDDPALTGLTDEAWNALVTVVRAARLADDMAAVIRRLTDGWAFGELFDDPVDGDNFWFRGVTLDGYENDEEDEMSPGEVAALRHARGEAA
jgi:hypothetical protein